MKQVTNQSELYYFYTVGCAYCKKVEPIVDELIEEGYNILKLDLEEPENKQVMDELKVQHTFRCGTPFFIDPQTGNNVCGSRDKETLIKWTAGEQIPPLQQPVSPVPRVPLLGVSPDEEEKFVQEYNTWREENSHLPDLQTAQALLDLPRPKTQAPAPLNPNSTPTQTEVWKTQYSKWVSENSHLPNIIPAETIIERVMKAKTNMQPGSPVENRIRAIEIKLDRLMNHLGIR